MSITVKEIAKQLNISASAVSMALNGRPGISEATRERVIQAAKDGGYNFSKIKSSGSKSGTLVFVIDKRDDFLVANSPVVEYLLSGAVNCCREHHYSLEIRYMYEGQAAFELQRLQESDIQGVILLVSNIHAEEYKNLNEFGLPIVILNDYSERINKDYILINNEQGAYLATEAMIKKKEKQPGYLRSKYRIENFTERETGYHKAVCYYGYPDDECIIHELTPSIDGAYLEMKKLIQEGTRLASGYFADNDQIAFGAMRAIKEAGFRIPEDISIVGFDDTPICEAADPPLASIHVSNDYSGRLAVERLLAIMHDPDAKPLKTIVSTFLVQRKSL